MKKRPGTSLVELLLALSACGVILTLSAGLIERMMRADLQARAYVRAEQTALRLASAFRRDVWQATAAAPLGSDNNSGAGVRLSYGDATSVEYRNQPGAVLRVAFVADKVLARETFTFPETATVDIREKSAAIWLLSIRSAPRPGLTTDGRPRDAYSPPLALEAVARLDRERALHWAVSPLGGTP